MELVSGRRLELDKEKGFDEVGKWEFDGVGEMGMGRGLMGLGDRKW